MTSAADGERWTAHIPPRLAWIHDPVGNFQRWKRKQNAFANKGSSLNPRSVLDYIPGYHASFKSALFVFRSARPVSAYLLCTLLEDRELEF